MDFTVSKYSCVCICVPLNVKLIKVEILTWINVHITFYSDMTPYSIMLPDRLGTDVSEQPDASTFRVEDVEKNIPPKR